jgi:hypothetical protein
MTDPDFFALTINGTQTTSPAIAYTPDERTVALSEPSWSAALPNRSLNSLVSSRCSAASLWTLFAVGDGQGNDSGHHRQHDLDRIEGILGHPPGY